MSDKTTRPPDVLDADTADAITQSMKPHDPDPSIVRSIRARVFDRINTPAPRGTVTVRHEEGQWRDFLPRVEVKVLRRDREQGTETVLYRLHPGAVVDAHIHTAEEECLVLEGEILIGGHYLRKGDFHVAQAGFEHPRTESTTGALVLVRQAIL